MNGKGSGWHGEPRRHSLARRGLTTSPGYQYGKMLASGRTDLTVFRTGKFVRFLLNDLADADHNQAWATNANNRVDALFSHIKHLYDDKLILEGDRILLDQKLEDLKKDIEKKSGGKTFSVLNQGEINELQSQVYQFDNHLEDAIYSGKGGK